MHIKNSDIHDLDKIFELYRIATAFMKSKNQVHWPEFSQDLIIKEIEENRQWKIMIEDQVVGVWATTFDDELIWGEKNNDPSIYIHRIASDPIFRGRGLVQKIVDWARDYSKQNGLKFIRLDTVGNNEGLIKHYTKCGFEYLGSYKLQNTTGLPAHYNDGDLCLFEIDLS